MESHDKGEMKLLCNFRRIAIEKWDHILGKGGSARTASKSYVLLNKAFDKIKANNMIDDFSTLLDDPEDCVSLEAACLLLREHDEKAKKTLQTLASKPGVEGLISFTAEMSLRYIK